MDECCFKGSSQVGSKGRHDTYWLQRTVSLYSGCTHPEQSTLMHLLIQASPYLVFSAMSVNALTSSHTSLLFVALVHLSSPCQGRKAHWTCHNLLKAQSIRFVPSTRAYSVQPRQAAKFLFFSMTCHHLPSSQDVVWKNQWVNSMWSKLYWERAEI